MVCKNFCSARSGERIEVQTVGSAGLWSIEADTNHLESAIINLGINARDAMPDGGKLTVEAVNVLADEDYCRVNPELSPGQYVIVCVTDTGHRDDRRRSQSCFRTVFYDKGAWARHRPWLEPSLWFRKTVWRPREDLQ